MSYYGTLKFTGPDRALSNSCIKSSGQKVMDSFVPSCSGMIPPHDASQTHLAIPPTDLDSDVALYDSVHRRHVVSPGQEATDSTNTPNEPSLDDDEWQIAFGQSLTLEYENWTDDTKERAFREALARISGHPKMLQTAHVFVFAATPSSIRGSLPNNFWVLTTREFRHQAPPATSLLSGYCSW